MDCNALFDCYDLKILIEKTKEYV